MKNVFIILFFICGSLKGLSAQSLKEIHRDAHQFIDDYFGEKININLNVFFLPHKIDDLSFKKFLIAKGSDKHIITNTISIDTILNNNDYLYIDEQINFWKSYPKISVEYLNNTLKKNIIYEREMPDHFKGSNSKYDIRIAPPLFSKNGLICILYIERLSRTKCGEGNIKLFKKLKDGTWKYIGKIPTWIS